MVKQHCTQALFSTLLVGLKSPGYKVPRLFSMLFVGLKSPYKVDCQTDCFRVVLDFSRGGGVLDTTRWGAHGSSALPR
jgi:hypothetical protein